MNKYELTESGKIFIAVVLVIVLLVIPSAIILAVASCSGTSPPNGESSESEQPPEENPSISDTPLPTPGSGFNPSDPETPEPSPEPSPEPTPVGDGDDIIVDDVREYGPVSLDLTMGTMSFIFSPDEQNTLDEDTVEMLRDFLSSPKNVSGTQVRVEMPRISDADEAALIAAVERAFLLYDIGDNGLVYVKSESAVSERYFEVALSFVAPVTNRK